MTSCAVPEAHRLFSQPIPNSVTLHYGNDEKITKSSLLLILNKFVFKVNVFEHICNGMLTQVHIFDQLIYYIFGEAELP